MCFMNANLHGVQQEDEADSEGKYSLIAHMNQREHCIFDLTQSSAYSSFPPISFIMRLLTLQNDVGLSVWVVQSTKQ